MKVQRLAWGIVNIGLGLAVLAGGWWLATHYQNVIDWWRLQNYTPPAEVARIADVTAMTHFGRDMFYVSDPQILDRDNFNAQCSTSPEKGKVLGCYTMQRIYLFDVTDPRLDGVKEVTAAHEMLHAVYERLDAGTRARVDSLLQAQSTALKDDERLQNLLSIYARTQPGEELNELHSILGTEYAALPPELEEYYTQYFEDRSKVVAFHQSYNAEFEASKARVAQLQQQLDALKAQIDANSAELETRIAQLNSQNAQLNSLRQSDPAAYNQQVPAYNTRVQQYNQLARDTQALVSQHNAVAEQINAEAAVQTELAQSLDSTYQPVSEN